VGGDTGISIGGYHSDREAFVFLEFLFSGWGGRPGRDGIDGVASIVVNFSNNPVEVVEAEYPLLIREYGFLPDTGGAGRYRGGLAVVREYEFTGDEAVLQIRSDRRKFLPYGLAGGREGTPSSNILNPHQNAEVLGSKVLLRLKKGDVLRHMLAGAGGFGDPFERDPEWVLRDVREEKISVRYAKKEYGVVIDEASMALDRVKTEKLRKR
jgi:N-methylhydantoinase B